MPNTPTTPAQVVSRLTDEEILKLADKFDGFLHDVVVVDILRDYVRMRKLNCELRKCLKETKEIVCDDCETENCETCTRNMKWRNLLAEAEKGAAE